MAPPSRDGAAELDVELQQARAEALGRVARRLEKRLQRLRRITAVVERTEHPDDRLVAAYRDAHAEATLYRWYLEVQREAIGLRNHDHLDEFYRVPPRVRL